MKKYVISIILLLQLYAISSIFSDDYSSQVHSQDNRTENVQEYLQSWARKNHIGTSTVYFEVNKQTAQALTDTTWTKTSFTRIIRDTYQAYDMTNNRFVVPPGQGGYYAFSGNVATTGFGANDRILAEIVKNASQTSGSAYRGTDVTIGTGTNASAFACIPMIYLEDNDYVEFWVYQDSGGSVNTTADHTCHFEGGRIR